MTVISLFKNSEKQVEKLRIIQIKENNVFKSNPSLYPILQLFPQTLTIFLPSSCDLFLNSLSPLSSTVCACMQNYPERCGQPVKGHIWRKLTSHPTAAIACQQLNRGWDSIGHSPKHAGIFAGFVQCLKLQPLSCPDKTSQFSCRSPPLALSVFSASYYDMIPQPWEEGVL